MYRCLIVADDLTGANASGVLLKTFGLSPLTLTGDLPPRWSGRFDRPHRQPGRGPGSSLSPGVGRYFGAGGA
jgi:hypothetical protein